MFTYSRIKVHEPPPGFGKDTAAYIKHVFQLAEVALEPLESTKHGNQTSPFISPSDVLCHLYLYLATLPCAGNADCIGRDKESLKIQFVLYLNPPYSFPSRRDVNISWCMFFFFGLNVFFFGQENSLNHGF